MAAGSRVEPGATLYAAGVSLGGSALLNWLGGCAREQYLT